MQLRPYQQKAEAEIYNAWSHGAQNVLVQLDTGAGKTVLFTKILADHQGWSVAIAHRVELVSQISLTLARHGVRHNIIAPKSSIRSIVAIHMLELKQSFYDPYAHCSVAGVDTLIKLDPATAWLQRVTLIIQDEAHHVLRDNKWGKAASLFPRARGLYVTATPVRADGYGLGRHADGIIDTLIQGPPMRFLINEGFLTDYKVASPSSNIDLKNVPLSAGGDYSPPKLREAVHKSHIVGDVVKNYLKFAAGKLGVTFAVDIESAGQIAAEFRAAGVPAEVVSSKTPDLLRAQIMRRFKNRQILQIVNVDLLGEGVDVPAIEVVIMARPTQSYALFAQQFGRALRPLPGKERAIIIDHVDNVIRHRPPDKPRIWSLDRRERRSRSAPDDVIPMRTCLNDVCLAVYERVFKKCPYCGHYTPPAQRSGPEHVDGDLTELSPETLAALRGEVIRVDSPPRIPQHLDPIAQSAVKKRHWERQQGQAELRAMIATWAGYYKTPQTPDDELYRRFYLTFNIDVMSAQALGVREASELNEQIKQHLINRGVTIV
jgi:DNA repair protein RadD